MVLFVAILVSGTVPGNIAESISSFYDPSDSSSINMTDLDRSGLDLNNAAASGLASSNQDLIASILGENKIGVAVSSKNLPISSVASSIQSSNSSTTEASVQSKTSCTCANQSGINQSGINAIAMKEQIKNKTSLLSKIKHRATHSRDALWASVVMTTLIVMLVVAVLHTKMWQDTTFLSYQESLPVKYEQYNSKLEIPVKDLLRGKARSLLALFKHKSRKRPIENALNMETFMTASEDTVDSSHQFLLESSSEDDMWNESDSDSEEEIVFKINKRTGDWEGGGDGSESLLGGGGGGGVRYLRRRGREKDELSNSILREISRVSSCSESSELEFMRIG